MLYNETQRSAWTVSEANHTVRSYTLKTSLLYTRCLRAVNITCIKSRVGLRQTVHSWVNTGVVFGCAHGSEGHMDIRHFGETMKLIDTNVLCTIFDIHYHPNIAHRLYKQCPVGPYSYGELNCARLHILGLTTFIYIFTPLLTSTHKPLLARAPSSIWGVSRKLSTFEKITVTGMNLRYLNVLLLHCPIMSNPRYCLGCATQTNWSTFLHFFTIAIFVSRT